MSVQPSEDLVVASAPTSPRDGRQHRATPTVSRPAGEYDVPHPQPKGAHMKITKSASVTWSGGLKEGKGAISTESGALADTPYGFNARFEGKKGSNPEELVAAAHASCFTMALSLILGEAGLTATRMDTTARVVLEKLDDGFAITASHLTLKAAIPGADDSTFQALAAKAKANCPVSKLLRADISLDATLDR
jgi:osmotically inducible protein OsmC